MGSGAAPKVQTETNHEQVRTTNLGPEALSEHARQLPKEQTAQNQVQLGPQREPDGQAQPEKAILIPVTQTNIIDDADSDSGESTSSAYTDLPLDEPEEGEVVDITSLESMRLERGVSADVVSVGRVPEVESGAKRKSAPLLDSVPQAGGTASAVKAADAEPVPREVAPQMAPSVEQAKPACEVDGAKAAPPMAALESVPSGGGLKTVPVEVAADSVPEVKGAESGPNQGNADMDESDSSDSDAGDVDSSCLPVTDPYLLIEAE